LNALVKKKLHSIKEKTPAIGTEKWGNPTLVSIFLRRLVL
jgi:hypothetical protein